MKKHWMMGLGALLAASPAMALSVTNLDKVPHRIAYDMAGSRIEKEIAPNATERFSGQPNGLLSLLSSSHPSTGGAVNADGILSGYIGNGRDQGIPADASEDFVIWPGGKLQLQRHLPHPAQGRTN